MKKKLTIILILLSSLLIINQCAQRALVKDWVLRVNDGVYPAEVPSTVIDMLIKNEVLASDFYYRDNFLRAYQYETKDSIYQLNFFISQQEQNAKYQQLIFEGLDTHCEVFLNNKKILQSHNMFRRYEISVNLQKLNNLIVKFYSPAKHDVDSEQNFVDKFGFDLPANYSFSRKASYHYGWDWGPRIASSGIWKEVFLNCYNETRIVDLSLKQLTEITTSTQFILSSINIHVDRLSSSDYYLLDLRILNSNNGSIAFNKQIQISQSQEFLQSISWNITQNAPSYFWWIWELGSQPLFTLSVSITNQKTKQFTDKKIEGLGFRTVKLIQNESQGGKQFTINLNGLDIYARGGNYIPPEMSLSKTTPQTYKTVINNAHQQNFNMIRVWGGGHFEKDEFYLQCDKNGILIWHDLMYACALYPYSQQIASNIEQQMRDNLIRLRHHPSISLWNGNNEVWIGWQEWGWKNNKTNQQKQTIETMYKSIFQNLLPKVIKEITPAIPYWETSPSVSSNSLQSIKSGDIHFWRVWGGGTPIEQYSLFIGRFNSEYGMQSMPDISTIQNFTSLLDRTLNSTVLRLHQRHPNGNKLLPIYVSNNTISSQNLTRFSYFSQVMQSYALELAITSLRGNKPYNMGSLYWQLNDVWPVSSWATIDYLQVKKASHYKIKEIYEPLKVACYDPTPQFIGKYILYAVNDYNKRFNCHFEIKTISYTGQILNTTTAERTLQPMSRYQIMKMYDLQQQISQLQDIFNSSFLHVDMKCVEKQSRSYTFFFTKMKNRLIIDPQLTYTYIKINNTVKISTKNLATYVWIYSYLIKTNKHYAFKNIEDNYFTLLPGETREIKLGSHETETQIGIHVTSYQIQALKEIKLREKFTWKQKFRNVLNLKSLLF